MSKSFILKIKKGKLETKTINLNRINKGFLLKTYTTRSVRIQNKYLEHSKEKVEYKLYFLSLIKKHIESLNVEIKIKDEFKEFLNLTEEDKKRIDEKYIDWMKEDMKVGYEFNQETGLTLEKIAEYLQLKDAQEKVIKKLKDAIIKKGFIE